MDKIPGMNSILALSLSLLVGMCITIIALIKLNQIIKSKK